MNRTSPRPCVLCILYSVSITPEIIHLDKIGAANTRSKLPKLRGAATHLK